VRAALPGVSSFTGAFPRAKPLLAGADGIPIDEFMLAPVTRWLTDGRPASAS
jgi:hypothetical protein